MSKPRLGQLSLALFSTDGRVLTSKNIAVMGEKKMKLAGVVVEASIGLHVTQSFEG